MEILILSLFCLFLFLCIISGTSIIAGLLGGLLLFLLYGRKKGFAWKGLMKITISGVNQIKGILITFVLIGILTAFWRAAGTIPAIVVDSLRLICPSLFLLMAFLLNSIVSTLIGTSFGTAATMGVICVTMGRTIGVELVLTAGACLAGCFVGDRCSPVSTSALLVAQVSDTDIYQNIKNMIKTAIIPFILTCLIYLVLGFQNVPQGTIPDMTLVFRQEFQIGWIALIPALLMLVLALFKVKVQKAMALSIIAAFFICLFYQNFPLKKIPSLIWSGYSAQSPDLALLINGGGILPMLQSILIVGISSSYSELFKKTGLLDGIIKINSKLAGKTSPFFAYIVTSFLSSAISCNQSLATVLTHMLVGHTVKEPEKKALYLEDSVILIASMIPWSIASSTPLTSMGAPSNSILFAFYLFILPVCSLLRESRYKRKAGKLAGESQNVQE